jgi:hypothetical protein
MSEQNNKKWVFFGVGLAAVATAAYLLFKRAGDKPDEKPVERVNFVDPSLS